MSLNGELGYVGPADALDRYELVERRAAGGEGEVWQARERHGEESFRYAVKAIQVDDGAVADRHLEELRLQAALATHLEHPALVKVKEVFVGPPPHPAGRGGTVSGRRLYFVMKWIDGRSLQESLERGEIRGLDVLAPLEPIAEAVDYLHSGRDTSGSPVLHRDIKPANLLLADDGRVYLVDFGLVRLRSTDNSRIFGTAPFMAPESLARGEYTPATDRYALGATVYYALTGEAPVPGDTDGMTQRLTTALGPGRDREVRGILSMLAVHPQARPDSAAGWLRALRTAPLETSVGGTPPAGPPSFGSPQLSAAAGGYLGATPKRRSSGSAVVIVLGVVVALVFACCWYAVYQDETGGGTYGEPSATRSFDKSDPPPPVTKLRPVLVSVGDIAAVTGAARDRVDAGTDYDWLKGGLSNLELCAGETVSGYAIGGTETNSYHFSTATDYVDAGSAVAGFYSDEAKVYFDNVKRAAERCGWNELRTPKLGERTLGVFAEDESNGRTAMVFVRSGQVLLQLAVNCDDCGGYQTYATKLATRMAKRMPKDGA